MKIFKGDQFSQEYNGPREANGIVKYMRAQVGPASNEIKSVEEYEKFLKRSENTLFAYLKDAESKLAKLFFKFAKDNREKYTFGHTTNAEVLERNAEE